MWISLCIWRNARALKLSYKAEKPSKSTSRGCSLQHVSPPAHTEERCVGLQLQVGWDWCGALDVLTCCLSAICLVSVGTKWFFYEKASKSMNDDNNVHKSCTLKSKIKVVAALCKTMSLFILWLKLSLLVLLSPYMKATAQSAESPACASAHLAVISPLNCSLIGPLQRLITLTDGSLPTVRPQRCLAVLSSAWLLSCHWVSFSSTETHIHYYKQYV